MGDIGYRDGTHQKILELDTLAQKLLRDGPLKTYPTPRRVRILFAKEFIADTTHATYVWEKPYYPYYYLPAGAFRSQPGDKTSDESSLLRMRWTLLKEVETDREGQKEVGARIWELKINNRSTGDIIEFLRGEDIKGLVRFGFSSADQWFEEDQPALVHPKDPFKRVDTVVSSRPVRVSLYGTTLASSESAVHLYETSLPVRFYMPMTHAVQRFLRPSVNGTKMQCPYKGESDYFDVVLPPEVTGRDKEIVLPDLVWFYYRPNVEVAAIAGMVCFYNEKVDIDLDGVRLERPKTHFV